MKKYFWIAGLLIVYACATHKAVSITKSDAEWGNKKFPGTTMADLEQGKNLYAENCVKCHGLKEPKDFSEEKWAKIMPFMAKKAQIDQKTEDLIYHYVVTMATAPKG